MHVHTTTPLLEEVWLTAPSPEEVRQGGLTGSTADSKLTPGWQ
jgi:hypothetical protein